VPAPPARTEPAGWGELLSPLGGSWRLAGSVVRARAMAEPKGPGGPTDGRAAVRGPAYSSGRTCSRAFRKRAAKAVVGSPFSPTNAAAQHRRARWQLRLDQCDVQRWLDDERHVLNEGGRSGASPWLATPSSAMPLSASSRLMSAILRRNACATLCASTRLHLSAPSCPFRPLDAGACTASPGWGRRRQRGEPPRAAPAISGAGKVRKKAC